MIKNLINDLKNKKVTKDQLKENYLDIAHNKNKDINAYISITDDYSKITKENVGYLSGIPGVIKDNINVLKDRKMLLSPL